MRYLIIIVILIVVLEIVGSFYFRKELGCGNDEIVIVEFFDVLE